MGKQEVLNPTQGCTSIASSNLVLDVAINEHDDKHVLNFLAPGLANNRAITKLDLSHSHLNNKVAVSLADVLRADTRLAELDLFGVSIGDDGIKKIGEALQNNKVLKK